MDCGHNDATGPLSSRELSSHNPCIRSFPNGCAAQMHGMSKQSHSYADPAYVPTARPDGTNHSDPFQSEPPRESNVLCLSTLILDFMASGRMYRQQVSSALPGNGSLNCQANCLYIGCSAKFFPQTKQNASSDDG